MSDSLLTPYELFQRKDSPNYWMRFSVRGKGQVRMAMFASIVQNGGSKCDIVRVVSEGELVVVHGKIVFSGQPAMAAADFFRVVDGKIVEHWDVLQPITESTTNPTPML